MEFAVDFKRSCPNRPSRVRQTPAGCVRWLIEGRCRGHEPRQRRGKTRPALPGL